MRADGAPGPAALWPVHPSRTVQIETLPAVSADWQELAERAACTPFVCPGWIEAWWRTYGSGRLHVVTVRDQGHLAAVLPLSMRGQTLRSPTNSHTPEFALLSADDDASASLCHWLLERDPRRIDLSHIDRSTPTVGHCRTAAAACGYQVISHVLARPPYIDATGNWDVYAKRLSRNRLKELRRRRRLLERHGPVTLEVVDGRHKLDGYLDEGFRVEAAGWKAREGSAVNCSPLTRRFYTDVGRWAARRGWLRLAFLRVGTSAIAFAYALEAHNVYYSLKIGYDETYRSFAPGVLLRYEMIRRAFAGGTVRYDLLGTDDAAKGEWAHDVRELVRLQVFAPSVAGSAARVREVAGMFLRQRATQLSREHLSPPLASKARRYARSLRLLD